MRRKHKQPKLEIICGYNEPDTYKVNGKVVSKDLYMRIVKIVNDLEMYRVYGWF